MKSYCVKEKRETACVPGSEKIVTIKNGRRMSTCTCASCGITKTKFVKSTTGGAIGDFSCGYDLKGKRPGTIEECFKKGQIRRYGIKTLDEGYLDALLASRAADRNQKVKARRKAAPKKERFPVPATVRFPVPARVQKKISFKLPPPPDKPLTEEEEKTKNRKRKLMLKRVIDRALKDAISDFVTKLKTQPKEIATFEVQKIGTNKYRLFDEEDDEEYIFNREKLISFLIKNISDEMKEIIAQEYMLKNKSKYGKQLVEELKEGVRYDTASDFDRGVKYGRVLVEEP